MRVLMEVSAEDRDRSPAVLGSGGLYWRSRFSGRQGMALELDQEENQGKRGGP